MVGSTTDRYKITDGGDWITAAGDQSQLTSGQEWPCNLEGCYAGMLIARYTTEQGLEMVFPVGARWEWTAPEHGELSFRINDTTFYDNTWYKSGGLVDHTSIEISPVE